MTKNKPQKMVPLQNVLIVAGLVLLLAFTIGESAIKRYLFNLEAPSPDYPAPANEAEARIQDLDYLELYVRGYDRSFSTEARGQALDMISVLKGKAGEMTFAEFELAVSRVVALANNGHSTVWAGPISRRHSALPVRGYWFDDGFYIVSADPGYDHLLGAKIIRIGDMGIETIHDLFRSTYGGRDSGFEAYTLPLMIQNPDLVQALGATLDTENPVITVVMPDGLETTMTLAVEPPNPDRKTVWAWRWLKPVGDPVEDNQSPRYYESEARLALYLQNGAEAFQMQPLPEINGLYVQYRQNQNTPGNSISQFGGKDETANENSRSVSLK